MMTCVSAADGMRVYKTAQHQIEQLVGKINGRFARLDWMPTLLFTQPIPLPDLFSYYRLADVCWTTPLRDGLNLVAKEYVVAREDRGGVLVLSEFVGAAVELPQAVLANPYSTQRMDEAIELALAMDLQEQKRRMAEMRKTVVKYDVKYWADHVFERFESMTNQKAAVKTTVAV